MRDLLNKFYPYHINEVEVARHLSDIVNFNNGGQIERLSVFHQLGTEVVDEEYVGGESD